MTDFKLFSWLLAPGFWLLASVEHRHEEIANQTQKVETISDYSPPTRRHFPIIS